MNFWDSFWVRVAPQWSLKRMQARTAVRHYEAAQPGRRTQGWNRTAGDANSGNDRAIIALRQHGRDLLRNNAWAKKGRNVIANNVTGWGIVPKPNGDLPEVNKQLTKLWKRWAMDSTECDADGLLTMTGLQHLIISALVESGEVLVRRRIVSTSEGLTVPLQLQVLESDYLDTTKTLIIATGRIIQGIEFDTLGRRVAYWLFDRHPGDVAAVSNIFSSRYPIEDVAHFYRVDRPGMVRGISWLAAAILNLKDLDEYEDAELMRQKIAACFAAFVTDADGSSTPIGGPDDVNADPDIETFEPGKITYLKPGKQISFGTPPPVVNDGFAVRTLRKIAGGLGVTYEDLTGDYSNVNFSSARMGRLVHQANVAAWQQNVMVPGLNKIWGWFNATASLSLGKQQGFPDSTPVEWICPPLPMLEPDKEGLAAIRLVRSGAMTFSEMIRAQGADPDMHFDEYASDLKRLDALGIKLDSDVRAVSQAGLIQSQQSALPGGSTSANVATTEGSSN